jgi:hypothetical protein
MVFDGSLYITWGNISEVNQAALDAEEILSFDERKRRVNDIASERLYQVLGLILLYHSTSVIPLLSHIFCRHSEPSFKIMYLWRKRMKCQEF